MLACSHTNLRIRAGWWGDAILINVGAVVPGVASAGYHGMLVVDLKAGWVRFDSGWEVRSCGATGSGLLACCQQLRMLLTCGSCLVCQDCVVIPHNKCMPCTCSAMDVVEGGEGGVRFESNCCSGSASIPLLLSLGCGW
jgi:hypothetical protein